MFLNSPTQQRGSALVVAIFIIVVMAVLAAVISRVLTTASSSVVDEVYGARAYHAANSGLQMFLTELFPLGDNEANSDACESSYQLDFSNQGLSGCSATVTCQIGDFRENYSVKHFRISALGSCDAAGSLYSRQVVVEALDESP